MKKRKQCKQRDEARTLRPLTAAFAPHHIIPNEREETLRYARFLHREDVLLRRESIYSGGPHGNPMEFKDRIVAAKSAFARLRDHGIAIPQFMYVIGEGREQQCPCLFTVIERVFGENISDIVPAGIKLARDVEGVFIRFLNYLSETWERGGEFWTDFNIHQFMYGFLERDEHPRIYLVDVEPYVGNWPAPSNATPHAREIASRSYIMQLMTVFLNIQHFEEHNNKGILLKRARVVLELAVRSVPPAPLYNEFRDNLLFLLRWRTP